MKRIYVNTSKPYEIVIGKGLLTAPDEIFCELTADRNILIVSDDNVYPVYGDLIRNALTERGCCVASFVFPHGEKSKVLPTYRDITEYMCSALLTRKDLVIALGGGVVGDLAGFVAATYLRGIDYIQIPTTLLAAVDSSVGGKTGLNLDLGKNQIGAFHQPVHVMCDINTLITLPKSEYANGCAEIIKYAMLGSDELFCGIASEPVCRQYENVIGRCVSMKKEIVEKDEFDCGIRILLNFGHTVGHAVECCTNYSLPHGNAVAIGMAVITKAAAEYGICDRELYGELVDILAQYSLPFETDCALDVLAAAILNDKKTKGDKITLVLPEKKGKCITYEIPKNNIPMWLKAGGIK